MPATGTRSHNTSGGNGAGSVAYAMTVLIGTSGWQYRQWHGAFYPQDVPQRQWLEY
jgi:hypothetical protein